MSPRLLIVDDSRLILRIVREHFSAVGWEVSEAASGAEALAILDASIPDVVVADILMPGMDGWALFEAVRARPHGAELPFVFLTTESDLPQRLRGLKGGADDYVTKPFAVEELEARVSRLVDRRPGLPGGALLAGRVEHLGIADLLQMLALNHKDAVVEVVEDGRRGVLVVEGGFIVHAACEGVADVKAVHRLLGWPRAEFRVMPVPAGPSARTMAEPATQVLMDGLVSLDEWNQWAELLPPLGSRLEVVVAVRDRTPPSDTTPAEMEVLARAESGRTVRQLLDESPRTDGELAEALCGLLTRGVLRPV